MQAALINSASILRYITILANIGPKSNKPKAPALYPLPDKAIKTPDKPGSFAFIARDLLARGKKRKEGGG